MTPRADFAARLSGLCAQCAGSIRRTFADHLPLYVCAVLFCIATAAIAAAYDIALPFEAAGFFLSLIPKFIVLGVALGMLGQLVLLARKGFPDGPARALGRWVAAMFLKGERPGNIFHTLLTFTPLMICFAALKEQIPRIHPFSWDATFAHWGRIIGFGHMPWELLQPVLGHPVITAGLNLVYESWFLMMFGALFLMAFAAKNSVVRMQFLLAFAFEWFIAGNVLAAVMSSAGPCFYGLLVHGSNPYAAQMAYLKAASTHWPIWSVWLQQALWMSYKTGAGDLMGISAMPSMHITSTALMAILAWRADRRLGLAMWIYTGLIVIGSIHLAWHYAADGIAGLALAFAFWWAAGWVLQGFALRPRANAADQVEAPAF